MSNDRGEPSGVATGHGNWLATLGSWLVMPAKAVLRPWWKQLVDEKAETLSVRQKLLKAIVRFRLNDASKSQKNDSDRAGGIALKIIERLKAAADDATEDLTGGSFLQHVENEIELHSVTPSAWMQLAVLANLRLFDPNQALTMEFIAGDGSQSHAASMIASIQGSFPFTKTMVFTSETTGHPQHPVLRMIGQLSAHAISNLKEFCLRSPLPEILFELQEQVVVMGWPFAFKAPLKLPKGWTPE